MNKCSIPYLRTSWLSAAYYREKGDEDMPQCPPGSDLVMLAASTALALSENLSADETNILSVLLVSIGDNLAIIAAKKAICEEAK